MKTAESGERFRREQTSSMLLALVDQLTATAAKSSSESGMSERANARATGASLFAGESFLERRTSSAPASLRASRPRWKSAYGATVAGSSSETMPRQRVLSASTARIFLGAAANSAQNRNSSSMAFRPASENGMAARRRMRSSQKPGVSWARVERGRVGARLVRRVGSSRDERSVTTLNISSLGRRRSVASGAERWRPLSGSSVSCRQVSKPGGTYTSWPMRRKSCAKKSSVMLPRRAIFMLPRGSCAMWEGRRRTRRRRKDPRRSRQRARARRLR